MKLEAMKQYFAGVTLSDGLCYDMWRTLVRFKVIKSSNTKFYVELANRMRYYHV